MSDQYDRAVVEAAVSAAPIFAARGWEYANYRDGQREPFIPDAFHLMQTVQSLVDRVREKDIDLDEGGYGDTSIGAGRWTVTRTITTYTYDPSDDDISITLELGSIEDPKIPRSES